MLNRLGDSKTHKTILSSSAADKKILWLSRHNKYLVVVPPMDKIIKRVYLGETDKQIVKYCNNELGFSSNDSRQILNDIRNTLEKELKVEKVQSSVNSIQIENINRKFGSEHLYKINGLTFLIEYETSKLEFYIHPKFAHLEILKAENMDHHLQLFEVDNKICLKLDEEVVGCWDHEMEHFMSGKVSMEILQKITDTKETDWMAVFHAAGVSFNNQGLLFLGDSGNGKSTLSAILMANGFNILADDFLPVLNETSQLCSFPAAISVKKYAIDLLAAQFPELKDAKEYEFPAFNKTVRYLSNPYATSGEPKKVECKALIFVKYEPGSNIDVKNLPKDEAFQKLVPDSWISPEEKNAKQFLNWFEKLPCWQIKYSNNEAMVETVRKIFEDEL